jgi:fumarate hydratase subunit beta
MKIININIQDSILSLFDYTFEINDKILLSGKIITARDQAHKRMVESIEKGEKLPIDLAKYPLYYCGPTPSKDGFPIGACGPTTSGRMDKYTTTLLEKGLKIMIGKGQRNNEVLQAITKHNAIYLIAIGGAGALYGNCVNGCRCLCYEDLGTEAIYELEVVDFPCYVGFK